MKLSKRLLILAIFVIVLLLSFFLIYKEGSLPVDKNNPDPKIFVIRPGEGLNLIINNLDKEDIIRNKLVFYLIVKRLGIEKSIQAGDFRLNQTMNAFQIAENLTHGTLDVWVTIIEGLRKEEIANIFNKNLDLPESEFVRSTDEGYLFPDTYLIPKESTVDDVKTILTNNFKLKYDQSLKNLATKQGLTDDEVIILASLVEKEGKLDDDRLEVASIILKRYKNGWNLQIDATIQYAIGYQSDEKTWWKKNLTKDDLEIDSLYNTYKYSGLPPAPICSPGLSSIKAVVQANPTTPYWYYISDKNRKMHYAVTLEEHNENIRKNLQ